MRGGKVGGKGGGKLVSMGPWRMGCARCSTQNGKWQARFLVIALAGELSCSLINKRYHQYVATLY